MRDARGLNTQTTDGRAVVTNMTYDNAGRMLTRTFPSATTENVTCVYDSVLNGNKFKGRLTSMTHDGRSISLVYDVRGNVITDVRNISGGVTAKTVAYTYTAADQIAQVTYQSGRQVSDTRDASGRITSVATRATSSDVDRLPAAIAARAVGHLRQRRQRLEHLHAGPRHLPPGSV